MRTFTSATASLCVAASMLSACAVGGAANDAGTTLSTDQIAAIVAAPDRSAADRKNDERRKPAQMLAFLGVKRGMTALDVSAGGGYTTELIARATGPTGMVYGQSAPAAATTNTARRTSPMALAERSTNTGLTNIRPAVAPFSNPVPADLANVRFDLVTLMFNYHDFGHMGVDRASMNRAIFAALKPGGTYVIADHAGRPGTGISESNTLHRVEEDFVVREVEAAGFKLAERGSFLRHPDDPRDREEPEPPVAKDEFVLKFVKPRA